MFTHIFRETVVYVAHTNVRIFLCLHARVRTRVDVFSCAYTRAHTHGQTRARISLASGKETDIDTETDIQPIDLRVAGSERRCKHS